ncbi:unnamed protein product [Brassica rapa subsp. trilocularis]
MMSVYGKESRYKANQSTTRRNCGKKQKKKKYCPQQACKLSILPDEIVMNCLAFVSRLDHGSLYLVSKLHRSLMLSPEVYQARSLMGRTEHCIYLSSCSIFRGGPWLGYICDWWDDWREAVVQGLFPGLPISYVDQSPFHDVSSSLRCGGRGGREDIRCWRCQGTKSPQMGSRDNVIYSCVAGGWILWCEASELEESAGGEMNWRQVMGLEDLRVALCASRVVNYTRGFTPSEYLDDMLPATLVPTCYSSGTVLLTGNGRLGVQRSLYKGARELARFGGLLSGPKPSQGSIVL